MISKHVGGCGDHARTALKSSANSGCCWIRDVGLQGINIKEEVGVDMQGGVATATTMLKTTSMFMTHTTTILLSVASNTHTHIDTDAHNHTHTH